MRANKFNYKVITETFETFCNKQMIEVYNDPSLALERFYELSERYVIVSKEKQQSTSIRIMCCDEDNGTNTAVVFTGYHLGVARVLSKDIFNPIFEQYQSELKKLG